MPTADEITSALDLPTSEQTPEAATNDYGSNVQTMFETLGDRMVGLFEAMIIWLPIIVVALLIMAGFVLLARWIGRWRRPFTWLTTNRFLQNVYQQITQIFIVGVGLFVVLEVLDATTIASAVLGTAGLMGLAIGFAFRDIVENYLAGILLSVRQPFAPNDHIEVGDHDGKVVALNTRATILLTFEGNHVRIPNATVFKNNLVNFTRNPMRRLDFVIAIDTDDDLSDAQDLGAKVLSSMKAIQPTPEPYALLEPPDGHKIGLHFYAWVNQQSTDFAKAKSEAIRLVTQAMAGLDVGVPDIQPVPSKAKVDVTGKTDNIKEAPVKAIREQDTSADTAIDEQIAKERAETDDLLEPDAPKE